MDARSSGSTCKTAARCSSASAWARVLRGGKGRLAATCRGPARRFRVRHPSIDGQVKVALDAGQFLKVDAGLGRRGCSACSACSRCRAACRSTSATCSTRASRSTTSSATSSIGDGVASTNNLRMRGAQAAVLMEGSADLERETQDLRVVVVPEINAGTASLAYAVINPRSASAPSSRSAAAQAADGGRHARVPRHRPVGRSEGRAGRAQAGRPARRRATAPAAARGRAAGAGAATAPSTQEDPMKIAALQMVSTPDVDANLAAAAGLIAEAAAGGAQLVALPEYFCVMGAARRRQAARRRSRPATGRSSVPGRRGARRTGCGWSAARCRSAAPTARARAQRLLRLRAPTARWRRATTRSTCSASTTARERYDEGARARSRQPSRSRCRRGELRVGSQRLLRPALSRAVPRAACTPASALRSAGVPSAFTYTTGRAHWELLLRARAIENQCYVVAAAQGGTHENGRRTWGHSMIDRPVGRGAGGARQKARASCWPSRSASASRGAAAVAGAAASAVVRRWRRASRGAKRGGPCAAGQPGGTAGRAANGVMVESMNGGVGVL